MIFTDAAVRWAYAYPYPAAIAGASLVAALSVAAWRVVGAVRRMDRPPAEVLIAAAAAAVCTGYSADTSWRFAEHRLGMTDHTERAFMFAAAEIALLACALLARANKTATATDTEAGSPGVPGVLVWVITGVQIIPCYAESGAVGGTVRAVIGPVLAGMLWHHAMGLEIRIIRPGALSTGLLAQIGRELRERLLSYLGLSVRERSAEQISRDRALARAVRLGSRKKLYPLGRRRLAAAVARAGVATDPVQKHRLMLELAARRGAGELTTTELPSAWKPPQPPAQPRTLPALAHQELAAMHPVDAIRRVHSAHPSAHPAELASLVTAHGVVVTEQMVRVAIGAGNPPRPHRTPSAPAPTPVAAPAPEPASALVLDVTTEPEVHPEVRAPALTVVADQHTSAEHARVPEAEVAEHDDPAEETPRSRPPDTASAAGEDSGTGAHPSAPASGDVEADSTPASGDAESDSAPEPTDDPSAPAPALPPELIEAARALGRPASLRTLRTELRIGQPRAQLLQALTRED